LDDSIKVLRNKINTDEDQFKNAFPDITKLLNIMSNLQTEIDSLKEKQSDFAQLANDVNEEMNRFEKELETTANQLTEITAEYSNEEEGQEADDEGDSSIFDGEKGEDFDSEYDSD
jgi:methyl-accepting chemotaxis protein